jgi:GT2 family glycosyltransferase
VPVPVVVAVVSWNTRELLDACLASMAADAEAGLAEVWVADNASTDGSPELVEERHPWVHLIRTGANLGFGRAVNLVAERSSSDWVVASNADIEVTPGALQALVDAGSADPRIGAVGPRLILPDGSTQHGVHTFPTLGDTLLRTSHLHRFSPRLRRELLMDWDPDVPAEVPWATGAFLVLRRSAFDQAGRFDEHQWLYAEDMDLCWRLARHGFVTRYAPAARVRHWDNAATRPAFGERFADQWMGATFSWMVRRQGIVRTWLTAGARAADAGLRAAILSALEARRPGRYAQRRDAALAEVRTARLGLRSRRAILRTR